VATDDRQALAGTSHWV